MVNPRLSHKGESNGNWKGGRALANCVVCGHGFSYYPTSSRGFCCSRKCLYSSDFLKKSQDKRFSTFQKKTPLKQIIKTSPEYKEWRREIHKRANYECTKCGSKSKLEANHIIPFSALYIESQLTGDYSGLFDTNNGETLCRGCHKKTDSYGSRALKDPMYRLVLELSKEPTKYREKMEKLINQVKSYLE